MYTMRWTEQIQGNFDESDCAYNVDESQSLTNNKLVNPFYFCFGISISCLSSRVPMEISIFIGNFFFSVVAFIVSFHLLVVDLIMQTRTNSFRWIYLNVKGHEAYKTTFEWERNPNERKLRLCTIGNWSTGNIMKLNFFLLPLDRSEKKILYVEYAYISIATHSLMEEIPYSYFGT